MMSDGWTELGAPEHTSRDTGFESDGGLNSRAFLRR